MPTNVKYSTLLVQSSVNGMKINNVERVKSIVQNNTLSTSWANKVLIEIAMISNDSNLAQYSTTICNPRLPL